MRRPVLLIIALGVATSAGAGLAPKWLEPTDEVIFPSIGWARAHAAGPLRVLFLTSRPAMREIVEIGQRFDIERAVFSTERVGQFPGTSPKADAQAWPFPGTGQEDQEQDLKRKLDGAYDVIVVGNIKWDILPEWSRQTILEKVRDGTGLVLNLAGGEDELLTVATANQIHADLSAFPHAGLPAFRQFDSFEAFNSSCLRFAEHGKGRIAVLNGFKSPVRQLLTPGLVDPFPDFHIVHYDYYLALAGHLMRWASAKPPAVMITVPGKSATHIDRERFASVEFNIRAAATMDVRAKIVLRHALHGTVIREIERDVALTSGDNEVSFDPGPVPRGTWFADLWIQRDGKVLAYGSRFYEVASASRIVEMALARSDAQPADETPFASLRADQPVRGKITISYAGLGKRVELSQLDNYGRVVVRKVIPVISEEASNTIYFDLRPPPPLSAVQFLEAHLLLEDELLDVQRRTFVYTDLHPAAADVRLLTWHVFSDPTPSYVEYYFARKMKHDGFDTWYHYQNTYDFHGIGMALLGNLHSVPHLSGRGPAGLNTKALNASNIRISYNDHGAVRSPCLSDPAYQNAMKQYYAGAARVLRRFGTGEYSLSGEANLVPHGSDIDLCFSDSCVRSFQSYLKKEYGEIGRLNEQYDASYTDWAQVLPIDLEQARRAGNVSLWVDHRLHMTEVWADWFALARGAMREVQPDARVGVDGSHDPGHNPQTIALGGTDLLKLAQVIGVNGPYHYPLQQEVFRDFAPPGAHLGTGWYGGYVQLSRAARDPLHHRWWVWNSFFAGGNSIWTFASHYYATDGCNFVAPDLSYYAFFNAGLEEIHRLQSGIGQLTLGSRREDDGIAVFYSPPSLIVPPLTPDLPQGWEAQTALPPIFAQAGLQYRWISPQQLEQGILDQDFKALYLPYCQAISPSETQAIVRFARGGGTVIADLRPAVADGHGKPYAIGPLDVLFGVTQGTRRATAVTGPVNLTGHFSGQLPAVRLDAGVRQAGGRALGRCGNVPAVIVNDFGKGKAVLLNLALSDYVAGADFRRGGVLKFKHADAARAVGALVRQVFAAADVAADLSMSNPPPGSHLYRYVNGDARIVGLMWDAPYWQPDLPSVHSYGLSMPDRAKHDRKVLDDVAAQSERVTLKLPGALHAYDMLSGEYLGVTDSLSRTLAPGIVHMLALTPYRVTGLSLAVNDQLTLTAAVDADPAIGKRTNHVLRIELVNPAGESVAYYSRNVNAPGGRYESTLNMALNDPAGTWRIAVADVMTGARAEATFTIAATQ